MDPILNVLAYSDLFRQNSKLKKKKNWGA